MNVIRKADGTPMVEHSSAALVRRYGAPLVAVRPAAGYTAEANSRGSAVAMPWTPSARRPSIVRRSLTVHA
jgi:hypothetical protein